MFAMLSAAALLACSPPAGAEVLWNPDYRFVVVGEIHGTNETPAAFAQLVCAAAERGAVTVALELPTDIQPDLDAFLEATDDASAAALLQSALVGSMETADGRTSVAMFEMMQAIWRLKADGVDVTIRAFQPSMKRPATFDQNYYELDMAVELTRAAAERPESRVLVLVGNIHASKTRFDEFDLMPAAAHLPRKDTITLNVAQQGGQAWNCQAEGCGPHRTSAPYGAEVRGIVMGPVSEGAWDGLLSLGPVTASAPATEDGSQPPEPTSSGSSS